MSVFLEVVFALFTGYLAVFYGACGTVSDTAHAVSTGGAPCGFILFQSYVVERTDLLAFSAADALIRREEILGLELVL